MRRPRTPAARISGIVGFLLSVATGLLLATVAFGIFLALAGSPTEGGYCSKDGIGRYETSNPKRTVVYLGGELGGFPPRQSCSVYLVEKVHAIQPLSAEELLRRAPLPHRLLAHGDSPSQQQYVWIIIVLLLPSALWCLALAATGSRR